MNRTSLLRGTRYSPPDRSQTPLPCVRGDPGARRLLTLCGMPRSSPRLNPTDFTTAPGQPPRLLWSASLPFPPKYRIAQGPAQSLEPPKVMDAKVLRIQFQLLILQDSKLRLRERGSKEQNGLGADQDSNLGRRTPGPSEVPDTRRLSLVASLTRSDPKARTMVATLVLSVLGTAGHAARAAVERGSRELRGSPRTWKRPRASPSG